MRREVAPGDDADAKRLKEPRLNAVESGAIMDAGAGSPFDFRQRFETAAAERNREAGTRGTHPWRRAEAIQQLFVERPLAGR